MINIPADVPKSVRKRIQEMIASGRVKVPMAPGKTTSKKTAPKKVAVMPAAYSIGVGERAPGMGDGLPRTPEMPVMQQQVGGASFESDYIDWLESKPSGPPRRPKGMGVASKSYQAKVKKYKTDMAKWEASKPSRLMYTAPTPAPAPAPDPAPAPPLAPTPPASDPPDKFEGRYRPPTSSVGTPDSLIPSNIVGQSFNPYLAAFAGGQQNPYQSSFMGPQQQQPSSTFGGYGQQAPMFAMAPYAGLAQSQPMPIDFFPSYVPRPDPIYETVPFPMPDPQPDAEPVMVAPRRTPVMTRPSAMMGAPLGRDQITEFLPYR